VARATLSARISKRSALKRPVWLAHTETITLNDLPQSVSHHASAMAPPGPRGTRLKDFEREPDLRALASSPP
jgi:hypothetical protein